MTYYNGIHTAIAVYAVYECDSMGKPNKKEAPRLHAWETLEALRGSYKAALEQSTSSENKTDVILASITSQFGRCLFMQDGHQLCVQCIVSEFMTLEENRLSIKDYETRIGNGMHNRVFDELISSLPDEPRSIFEVQCERMGVGDWDGDCVGVVNFDDPNAVKDPTDDEIVASLVKQVKGKASTMTFTSKPEQDAEQPDSTKYTSMSHIVSL